MNQFLLKLCFKRRFHRIQRREEQTVKDLRGTYQRNCGEGESEAISVTFPKEALSLEGGVPEFGTEIFSFISILFDEVARYFSLQVVKKVTILSFFQLSRIRFALESFSWTNPYHYVIVSS